MNSTHYRIATRLQAEQSNLCFASCSACLAASYARARAFNARARANQRWLVMALKFFHILSLLSCACGNRIHHKAIGKVRAALCVRNYACMSNYCITPLVG